MEKKIQILVIDDSATTRKITRKLLNDLGYDSVEEAIDGASGWNKIVGAESPITLVICDWHMPNLSGLNLLKKIRAVDQIKNLPFIMLTGENKKDEVMKAIQAGASAYLVKPLESTVLKNAIEKALSAKNDMISALKKGLKSG